MRDRKLEAQIEFRIDAIDALYVSVAKIGVVVTIASPQIDFKLLRIRLNDLFFHDFL